MNKSHIVPNFLYQSIFDTAHSLFKFNLTEQGRRRVSTLYNGEYEGGILCEDCDQGRIGTWEDYVSRVFYGGKTASANDPVMQRERQNDVYLVRVKNIDYSKFKLFLLSILWRASISSRPFFEYVRLGNYEEEIRKMLFTGDAGAEKKFPCILSYIPKSIPATVLTQPFRSRGLGKFHGSSYWFIVDHFLFMYCISGNRFPHWGMEAIVKKTGEFCLLENTPEQAKDMLNSALGQKVFK